MRVVRIFLSLVVLAFGFMVAMFLVLIGLVSRLFGRRAGPSTFNVRFQRTDTRMPPRPAARGDVIDIEATPVKD